MHHEAALPATAFVCDISNACLGLLNGLILVADMIELGQIRAGVVVGTEDGRALVESTIDSLLANTALTRQEMKADFASLTIGSGSAAIVLCDRKLSRRGHRLLGGGFRADTTSHELCTGGDAARASGDALRMQTDSESLLHAGIDLAADTWCDTKRVLSWSNEDVHKVVTHQIGRAHRKLLFQRLGLDPSLDLPTVEFLGNTGAAALPTALSLGIERNASIRTTTSPSWASAAASTPSCSASNGRPFATDVGQAASLPGNVVSEDNAAQKRARNRLRRSGMHSLRLFDPPDYSLRRLRRGDRRRDAKYRPAYVLQSICTPARRVDAARRRQPSA